MATKKRPDDRAASRPQSKAATAGLPNSSLPRRLVDALASARLTVALMLAAIAITLVGTLAQAYMDIWEVVDGYFHAWICWVDVKVFFPVAFFPWAAETDWDSLAVHRFPAPGGALIGLALALNLAAAHAIRFKVVARGARLVWGLIVLAAGVVTTWLVIEAGHNRQGLQGEPLVTWATLWLLIRIGLVALWLACLVGLVRAMRSRKGKRGAAVAGFGACALALGLVLAWIFAKGEAAVLTDSSLRILYQLIQGQIAALVLLAACVLLFRQRAGNVLLHGGVALMMFGEFFVSYFAAEQQMTLVEGETVSYTRDIRSVELAITTLSLADHDDVVAVPMETKGRLTQFARGRTVDLDDFPFHVEVLHYYGNSKLVTAAASQSSNPATKGVGTRFIAEEVPPQSGVQSGNVDLASAYVKFTDKENDESLGTYLLTQHFSSAGRELNTVSAGGADYGLALRFKRSYKPYRITLLDVRKDDYVGTAMARNYSSRVRLEDPSRNIDFETTIWMNNPLRYAGETFYQSGYNVDGRGRQSSTLQIVKNTGWMIPYVSCMIIATGMLTHFLLILLRFLSRVQNGADSSAPDRPKSLPAGAAPGRRGVAPSLVHYLVPLAVVVLAAAWVTAKALPPRSPDSRMKLERFGALPLMYEGRVKPFDTLARNSLRIISNRETFVDAEGDRQPAIRWLLDVIARPEAAEKHAVFRIDGLELLKSLGLQRRHGFRYAWEEIKPESAEFQKQVALARRQDPQQRTFQQRKLLELVQRLDRYRLLAGAFRPLPFPAPPTREEAADNPEEAAKTVAAIRRLMTNVPRANQMVAAMRPPLAVPTGSAQDPWEAYAVARNNAHVNRQRREGEPDVATTKLAAVFEAYDGGDAQAFNRAVADYEGLLADRPPAGLNPKITRFEAYFNHVAPFYHSLLLYMPALLLTALGWLAAVALPRLSSLMRSSAFWLIALTFAIHTFALAARVVISGRPPVTNLYSSAVFIGWGCVGLGLILEVMFRLGVGNFVSATAGIGTLIIAHFLAGDGDTIRVLQAVLDTQFWLTVHVLTITLGYSATFLAGLLGLAAVAYGLGKTAVFAVDSRRNRRLTGDRLSPSRPSTVERNLDSMIYGAICFAAFFSLVGTVLGGLWADDSWGRFWGWDPKENGALIVVLWTALVLHARWARLVRERGMAMLAVGGNIVTSWSWFGVNELGVGLHSYGFTEGVARTLLLFWVSQLVVIALAALPQVSAWFVRSPVSARAKASEAS